MGLTKLPVGEYTITELTDWSWRYEHASAERTVLLEYNEGGTVVEYDNTRQQIQWLDGNDVAVNKYTK